MAGDWIKIEMGTPDKPEVCSIAAALKMDPDAVTGKLLRIWIWADMHSMDGAAVPVTEAFLDRLTHRKGFAAAMRKVGWLRGSDGMLEFPGFHRHNGQTAKARADANRRMAKSRAGGCRNVANFPSLKAQPEKRREEKKEESELSSSPPMADTLALIAKIKSLRTEWEAPAILTAKEKPIFESNRALFASFTETDWITQREFLAARLPDGNPGWQPRSLIQYLEHPSDVLAHARSWKAKHRPPTLKSIIPPQTTTPEDRAALADFLNGRTAKA